MVVEGLFGVPVEYTVHSTVQYSTVQYSTQLLTMMSPVSGGISRSQNLDFIGCAPYV